MFEQEIRRWRDLHSNAEELAYKLWHWSYYKTFLDVIDYIEQKAPSTDGLALEIERKPVLLTYMISTMMLDIDNHVRPEKDIFLDLDILGTFKDFQKWQEYGYKIGRSKRNYEERFKTWVKIFNGEEVIDDNGRTVTYETIIDDRMKYSPPGVVPYWIIWNNGSRFGSRDGHPSYPGLHFVEFGKKRLKYRSASMRGMLQSKFAQLLLSSKAYDPDTYNIPVLQNAEWIEAYKIWRSTV